MHDLEHVPAGNGAGAPRSRTLERATPTGNHRDADLKSGCPFTASEITRLQRTAGNAAVASALGDDLDGSLVHSVIATGGQPLEPSVQKVMESHLGADLSDVRVHTDGRASESAQAIQARAYTAGSHIVFQRDHYQPGTEAGLRTLAHELTHVVQQRSGPVDGTAVNGGVNVSHPSDRFERAAEQNADIIMRSITGSGGMAAVQTADEDSL